MHTLDLEAMILGKSFLSFPLLPKIVAQNQMKMALSKQAHQLYHAILLRKDVLVLLQLHGRKFLVFRFK